ncbi:MAG: AAA family ATPase [Archaeoglobaceae archaeon]
MKLKKVCLEDFISHRYTEVEFEYGINVVIGPNGAGKTSILDAISFGLFNIHSRGKNENLIRKGAEKAKVVVEFSEGGLDYAVEVEIDQKKKQVRGVLFRIQNGERTILAKGGSRVITSEIEKILGMDGFLFQQSIYVQQGEIERLITTRPAERKEIISKLLGIDDLEKAYSNMKELLSDYEKVASTLRGELKRKQEVENKLRILTLEIENLRTQMNSNRDKLVEINSALERLKSKLEEFDQKLERFKELNPQKAALEERVASLNDNLERKREELREAEIAHSKIEELKEEVAKIPILESYLELYQKIGEKERERSLESRDLQKIKELEETIKRNEILHRAYLEKSELSKQKMEERRKYEGLEGKITTLESEFEKEKKKLGKKSEELSRKLEECSKILGEDVTLENLELVSANKKEELERMKNELDTKTDLINKELGAIQKHIEEVQFKLSKISEAKVCPLCGRELTPEHRKRLQEEFKDLLRESNEKIKDLEEELGRVSTERKDCDRILKKLASIDAEGIKELGKEILDLNISIAQKSREIEKLREDVVKLKKVDEEIAVLEKELKKLEEAHREYEVAKQGIAKWPPLDEVEAKLRRICEEIDAIQRELEDLTRKLGYKPEDPKKELNELRRKKEEFDKNETIAKKRDSILSEVQNLEKELSKAKGDLKKILSEIEELKYDEKAHRKIREDLERKMQERSELEKEIVRLQTEIQSKEGEMSRCESEVKKLVEKEKELKVVEDFIKILEKIRGAFHKDGIQRIIRARAKPLLENYTREFFERFNLEFSDVQMDDDYNVSVIGALGTQTIDQISGGERVALAIALRLAIARVLSDKVETIIMDEPTTHLDEERRRELVNILNSFFREGSRIFPQMIVITHHGEIEEVADVVYSVKKKEGYSVVESKL